MIGLRSRFGLGASPAWLGALALLSVLVAGPVRAATFTVNDTGDADDLAPDGLCDSAPGPPMVCTLRAAIREANSLAGPDTINFNIGAGGLQMIAPNSPLPSITEQVIVDGTTQPGYAGAPIIELNGVSAGPGANGLILSGGSSTIKGLVIDQFAADGIRIVSSSNVIVANYLGTDPSGTLARGNAVGVSIQNSSNNRIGGTTAAERNIISTNTTDGVRIVGPGTTNNLVQGNYIGTNAAGTMGLGVQFAGVAISDSADNVIGTAGAGNLVSGNDGGGGTGFGVIIDGSTSTGNVVRGNTIGLDVTGTVALGNGNGLYVTNSTGCTIGGVGAGDGNVISGHSFGDGMGLIGGGSHLIQGNRVGTNAAGTGPLPNFFDGIGLNNSHNNRIGGTAANAGNLVSGGSLRGVSLNNSNGNTVEGNFIGTDVTGTLAIPNSSHGVVLFSSASGNRIGGPTGAGNFIAYNFGGVVLEGTAGSGNQISSNAIYLNGALGIDLGPSGVTPNDVGDADSGPNNLQNYPLLISAMTDRAGSAYIAGTLNSAASTTYRIEFFSSSAADPSGFGEGQRCLGFTNVTTDGAGDAVIDATLATILSVGDVVTGTATDPSNNTSEFSAAVVAVASPEADLRLDKTAAPDPVTVGGSLTYTLTVTNNGPSSAPGVALTDPLPTGMEFVSSSPGTPTCNFNPGPRVVSCTLGGLASSGNTVVTITVTAHAAGAITNTATVGLSAPATDPNPSDNTARVTVTVDVPGNAVRAFTVTSGNQTNRLEWLNPTLASAANYVSTTIVHRTDRFPVDPSDGMGPPLYDGGSAGQKDSFPHTLLMNDQTYYYAAFVILSGGPPDESAGRFNKGRPFDDTGSVKWAFSMGTTSLAPPGNGVDAIHTVANDGVLYSAAKGLFLPGGTWPTPWFPPPPLMGPSQGRPSTVPVSVSGSTREVFLGSQDGQVHARDADTGGFGWSVPVTPSMVQAGPSGIFGAFGGAFDYILVGTRASAADNAFYALNVGTGSTAWSYGGGGPYSRIGVINGQAATDYAGPGPRVYFGSYRRNGLVTDHTVWCLDLVLTSPCWATALGDVDVVTGVSLRKGRPYGDRLYVGTLDGKVYALRADNGAVVWSFATGDGPIKDFIMTDRLTDVLFFSTTRFVWSLQDDGAGRTLRWSQSVTSPSSAVYAPGSVYVFVGSGDGKLHRLQASNGLPVAPIQLGDGNAAAGSPTLDLRNNFLYAGSEAGIVYSISPIP